MSSERDVVLLTGGGGIIGRSIAARLAQADRTVAVVDRDLEAARSVCDDVPDTVARPYQCDVTDRSALETLRAHVEADLGRVTALINNAAAKSDNFFAPFPEFPLDDWNEVIAVNLTGPMLCSQVFGTPMADAGYGSIVNVLSIYGIRAPDQRIYDGSEYEGRPINTPAVYSASKAGLWGLTQYLAGYWGSAGVRVNAVVPGGVFSGQNDTFVEAYATRTMLGRMAQADEIAAAVEFLVADDSSYVTGQRIIVDGGLSAW